MTRLALALSVVAFAPASTALACRCVRSAPADALARAAAVFEGRVLEVTPVRDGAPVELGEPCVSGNCDERSSEPTPESVMTTVEVRFSITRQWKGVTSEEIRVRTARDSAACGFPFEVGEDYLVYASAEQGGALSTGLCDRTARVADASEDLTALDSPGDVPVDVQDEEPTRPDEPPARGGCASCAASGQGAPLGLLVLAPLALRRRRH